jgi:hypothetical protein
MDGCGHCGYQGRLERRGDDVVASRRTDFVENYGDIVVDTRWALFKCPNCGEPTLGRYVWIDDFSEPTDLEIEPLYPKPVHREALPPAVLKEYELALRGRRVDPAFYVIGVRRTLEAICDHEGVKPGSLNDRLDDLSRQGPLPRDLEALTASLRKIDNFGAHTGVDLDAEDMAAVGDLLEALVEYLYRAPATLQAVRESFGARGTQI